MTDYAAMFGQGGLNDQVDPDALLSDIGLDREEIQWRKDFVDFDAEDEKRLDRYADVFEAHSEEVAEMFYENITAHEETTAVIGRSPKGIEALKQTQQAYLVTLATGDYGPDYFRDRARIGKLHDVLDMPMKQYIGQYGVYYNLLVPLVTERVQDQLGEAVREAVAAELEDVDVAIDGGGVAAETDLDGTAETDVDAMEWAGEDGEKESEADGEQAGDLDAAGLESAAVEAGISAAEDVVAEGFAELHSILKLINLDMQVVADTYIHSYTEELDQTIERQREVASEVQASIDELAEAADAVANSTNEINGLAEDQRENMDQIAGEVSNLSATIEEVASSANTVAAQSQDAREMAETGQQTGEEARAAMEEVDAASEQVQADLNELQETVEEIDSIVEVINDIADQTNLLALNANIEAARAGEAGSGFAVVADEVKSLAEDSQAQAGEIEAMLEEIRENTEETVDSLADTREEIDHGVSQVEDSIDMLDEIATIVEDTVAGIEEVSEATDEQAASAEEIAAMVDQAREQAGDVATETEDVAASTEEQAASVQEIQDSVERLESDD